MFTLVRQGEPYVVLNLSEAASNAALDALGEMMNGGHIELLSGDDKVLATLQLSNPAAYDAANGEIELREIYDGTALVRGQATTARVVAADGAEVLLCDVSDESGDGVIKLNTTQIALGSPVRIGHFRIAMP